MWRSIERVEWLRVPQWRLIDRFEQLLLEVERMLEIRSVVRLVITKHPLHGIEAVKARRIEGRAEKSPAVVSVTDAFWRQGQVLELRKPPRDWRPRREAIGRMKEGATFARHRIFVAAADIECAASSIRSKRLRKSHESVIAIDNDPRPELAESVASSSIRSKTCPLPNSTWLTKIKSWLPLRARPRKRSEKPLKGLAAMRSTSIQPSSSHRASCRRALWNSPSVVKIAIVRFFWAPR